MLPTRPTAGPAVVGAGLDPHDRLGRLVLAEVVAGVVGHVERRAPSKMSPNGLRRPVATIRKLLPSGSSSTARRSTCTTTPATTSARTSRPRRWCRLSPAPTTAGPAGWASWQHRRLEGLMTRRHAACRLPRAALVGGARSRLGRNDDRGRVGPVSEQAVGRRNMGPATPQRLADDFESTRSASPSKPHGGGILGGPELGPR